MGQKKIYYHRFNLPLQIHKCKLFYQCQDYKTNIWVRKIHIWD